MTKEQFESYYMAHYKPLLEKAARGEEISSEKLRLFSFLQEDIEETFLNESEGA